MYKWLFLSVLLISGGILWVLYSNIYKLDKTPGEEPVTSSSIVHVTHAFKDEIHRFSGEIKLPHSCYATRVEVVPDVTSKNAYIISIVTTDRMLEQSICLKIPTRYPFMVLAEAPEDISFTLMVDNKLTEMRVTNVDWVSSSETILDPL